MRDRNVGFAVVARTNAQVQAAISRAIDAQLGGHRRSPKVARCAPAPKWPS